LIEAMGYAHISNLYKDQSILLFRRCWAMEKVHGTSAHVTFRAEPSPAIRFFSGGESHERFVALFDRDSLVEKFLLLGHHEVTIYGEAYGGRQQGMRETYGDELRFIAFDVQMGGASGASITGDWTGHWLSVPDACQLVVSVGLEFVPYADTSTDLADLDRQRDAPSEVARRRGCGDDKAREGVVLRPPVEMALGGGRPRRVVAKHKREAFSERATPQKIVDPAKLAVLAQASAIAQEWVTPMRLSHVLARVPGPIDKLATGRVILAMIEDVYRESAGEIVQSRDAATAIGRRTSELLREWIRDRSSVGS
jgi:hypothetical protein